jgi:hypothetical protein
VFVPHQLLYFTGLRCCCVCPTPIALFYRLKMLLCFAHNWLWDKHNNILNLWNKAIGVGETQQLLKPVKSNNSCVQTQHLFVRQLLFDFTGLRCWCVCPTPNALFHRFKMLLCLYTTIVWFHRLNNNILNLWNKAFGVGQTQQHLKSVK